MLLASILSGSLLGLNVEGVVDFPNVVGTPRVVRIRHRSHHQIFGTRWWHVWVLKVP